MAEEQRERLFTFFYAALGFLIAFTLFLPGEQPEYTGAAHLPCILWLLAAVSWIYIAWKNKREMPSPACLWADKFIGGFFLWVIFSIAVNLFYGGGYRPSFNNLSVWFLFAAAYFLFREILQNTKIIRTVFAVITAVILAQALTGLYQQFVDIPEMQRQFDANPEAAVAAVNPSIKPGTADWELLAARLKTAAPAGTYPLSNSLGGLLAGGLFLALGIRRQETGIRKYGVYAVITVIAFCLVLTKCRSGIIAAGSGFVFLIVFNLQFRSFITKKRIVISILLLFITSLCIALFVPKTGGTGKSIINGAERSLGFRLEYWKASAEMIADNPLFGCGSGNFKQTYTKYKLPVSSEEIADPHNFAVEIAAESGLPASVLFLISLIMLCRKRAGNVEWGIESNTSGNDTAAILHYIGLLGCWAAYFFSFGTEAPMPLIAPLAATISFPLCAYLFSINTNGKCKELSKSVFIALIVLLVHLSAAGGISVPSTALLIWLFLAVLFNRFSHRKTSGVKGRILCILILIPAVLFVYGFGLQPVSQTRKLMLQLEDLPVTDNRRTELLQHAVNSDRWSADLREQQTDLIFRSWSDNPKNVSLETEAAAAVARTLLFLPRSAGLRFRFAERYAGIYERIMSEKTGNDILRLRAAELYRQAIELYPNNAVYRAEFAMFLAKNGKTGAERNEALKQRDKALQLDDAMPHKDRKLKSEQRTALENLYHLLTSC